MPESSVSALYGHAWNTQQTKLQPKTKPTGHTTSYIFIDFIRFILVSGNGKEKIINKTIILKKIDIISVIFF